jgi:hypothetical protein
VRLAAARRDIEFEFALERVRVVKFAPGEIVFAPAPDSPPDLARRLVLFLREETGADWRVRVENAAAAPVESLAERRKKEAEREMEALKAQPFIAEALKHFPGAAIVKVTHPTEDEEPAGQVVPMPQPGAPSSDRRKKEADR